jgi:hypothetical protein
MLSFKPALLLVSIIIAAPFTSQISKAQSPETKLRPTGSISGHVMIDGKAAAGIPIAAVAGNNINRRDSAGRAITDIEGYYLLSGLAPGQYQIWTLTPGFVAEPGPAPNYYSYYGSIKSIFLNTNEAVANVDLQLIRGGVITGRVTTANNKPVVNELISLQLLDERGNPRLGALGSAYDQMYQTDDRGIYRIYGLPPGRYRVSVGYDPTKDGLVRNRRYEKTFYVDPVDESKAGTVELKEGDEAANIDIKVKSAAPSYSVAGRVVDGETGLPIARAGITFVPVSKGNGPPQPGFGIQADDRGEFSFSGFAAGHYSVYASSEYYGGNYYSDPVYFDVSDKDVTGIEIKTTSGLSVSGVVTAEGLSTKELLALVPGLSVSVSGNSSTGNQFRVGGRSAVGPDGSFQVEGLRPGAVSVFVARQRHPFVVPRIVRLERNGVPQSEKIDLQQSISGLRIVIDYGTGVVRGTVRFEGEASISDARMYVSCKREGARDGPGTQVDSRGNFLISNLGEGAYEVTLQINALTPRPSRQIPIQKQLVKVANGAASEVNFVIDLTTNP